MTKTIENFFNYLASYSHFLPILFFIFYFKESSKKVLWLIVLYDFYNYLTDLGFLLLGHHKLIQIFLYSSFTLVEYSFFASALYSLIKSKNFRKIIFILSICFTLFIIPYNIFANLIGIDSIPIGVETILILIFSFYYLYEQMQNTESSMFIYTRYSFWIVLGMMLYLSGSFFIYIYTSQLPNEEVKHYWIFTNIFSILKNIFFTIAIIIHANQFRKKQAVKNSLPLLN